MRELQINLHYHDPSLQQMLHNWHLKPSIPMFRIKIILSDGSFETETHKSWRYIIHQKCVMDEAMSKISERINWLKHMYLYSMSHNGWKNKESIFQMWQSGPCYGMEVYSRKHSKLLHDCGLKRPMFSTHIVILQARSFQPFAAINTVECSNIKFPMSCLIYKNMV